MSSALPGLRVLADEPGRIHDDDVLLRIIPMGAVDFTTAPPTIKSNGFQDQTLAKSNEFGLASRCMSVNVKRIWQDAGYDLPKLLAEFDANVGIAEFRASAVRNLETVTGESQPQGLMLDPREGRPWHAVMFDMTRDARTTGGRRACVEASTWFRVPVKPTEMPA